MIFKSLNIYQMAEVPDTEALESYFETHKFRPCLPSHEVSRGFSRILGKDCRVMSINGIHLFCMLTEEKILPTPAIKTQLNRLIQELEKKTGKKITRQEKADLKEQVTAEMLPKAFTRMIETWAYIDSKSRILVIDSNSQKQADGIARLLKGVTDGGIIFPLRPKVDLADIMAKWIRDDKAPDPFELGTKCEIQDDKGTIRYRHRSLEDDNLKGYLDDNLRVKYMSFESDRTKFVMTEDFLIKEFSLNAVALSEIESHGNDPWMKLETELQAMAIEVRKLLSDLLKAIINYERHSS